MSDERKDKKGLGDKTSSSTLKWVNYSKKESEEDKKEKKSYLDFDYYDDYYDDGYSSYSSYGGYYKDRYSGKSWYDYYGDKRKKNYNSSLSSRSGSSSYYSSSSGSSWWKSSGSSYSSYKRSSMSSLISSYSSTSLSKDVKEQLTSIINKSIKLTREFIAILDLPFKITLNFKEVNTYSSGNYRSLYIPTKVVDYLGKDGKTEDVVINTIVGLGIHEAAHLMYTNCKDADSLYYEKGPYFFLNLIEDYRVEDCLMKERPGYQDFINIAMEFRVSELEKGKIVSEENFINKEISDILLNTVYMIRFPNNIDKDVIKKYNTYFDKIRAIVEPDLQSTSDSVKTAREVYKELIDYIKTQYPGDGSYSPIESLNSLLSNENFYLNYYVPILYGKDKTSSKYGSIVKTATDKITSYKVASDSFDTDLHCCLGDYEEGEEKGTFFKKTSEGNKKLYQQIATEVSKFVPMIKKQVMNVEKNTTINLYGCRQGLLDTSKIVEAIQNVPQVYYRTGKVSTSKVSIGVLVDESGSMWGDREEAARSAAILLNEAFGNIPGVDLFIYGHTADETDNKYTEPGYRRISTDIRVYKEPGFNNQYALTDIQARYENRDGVAILETAKRIRKFTKDPCILFVISDGRPSATKYRDYVGINDTKEKVKIVENMGFEVIQITINNLDPEVKNMFSKSISLEDNLDDLPKELGKVLKKAILDNKVTTITW